MLQRSVQEAIDRAARRFARSANRWQELRLLHPIRSHIVAIAALLSAPGITDPDPVNRSRTTYSSRQMADGKH